MATTSVGQKFGRLIVQSPPEIICDPDGHSRQWVMTICHCGVQKKIRVASLIKKILPTTSCGCLCRERVSKAKRRHGEGQDGLYTSEWRSWHAMRQRCTQKTRKNYHRYGGRGISVCARWDIGENGLTGYQCFLADMGRKPSPRHTIDRINNDGNYEPKNCRWATMKEQQKNKEKRYANSYS